jgi:hypothetical protein
MTTRSSFFVLNFISCGHKVDIFLSINFFNYIKELSASLDMCNCVLDRRGQKNLYKGELCLKREKRKEQLVAICTVPRALKDSESVPVSEFLLGLDAKRRRTKNTARVEGQKLCGGGGGDVEEGEKIEFEQTSWCCNH